MAAGFAPCPVDALREAALYVRSYWIRHCPATSTCIRRVAVAICARNSCSSGARWRRRAAAHRRPSPRRSGPRTREVFGRGTEKDSISRHMEISCRI